MKPRIIAHCLVANEERFIWYALQSVLPFVAKVMVWDTGSVDRTPELIRSLNSEKIAFRQLDRVDAGKHTQIRQQMLSETDKKKFDWLMILDGDEIWPDQELKSVIDYLSTHPQKKAVVVRTRNVVGDVYHELPQSAGQYEIAGQNGHLGLRFINLKLPDLAITNPHGGQTYVTDGMPLQNLPPGQLTVLDNYYIHTTHLPRSSADQTTLKRTFKRKLEIGERIGVDQLPSVFFHHPDYVPAVTGKAPLSFWLLAALLTPLKRLRRLIIKPASGY